ncbi:hypothetical protein B0H10DRAFT_1954422 [Mycena sp. CBHHK59/15]|nr:hypothetical protein B0H10DRAFT_1954422 [Mycena sp. CBHHK59/15]
MAQNGLADKISSNSSPDPIGISGMAWLTCYYLHISAVVYLGGRLLRAIITALVQIDLAQVVRSTISQFVSDLMLDPVDEDLPYIEDDSGWPCIRKPDRVRAFPSELWTIILFDVCGSDNTSFFTFNEARDAACYSFDGWNRLILGTALFWRKLTIDSLTTPASVERHVRHAPSWMDVNILFDITDTVDIHTGLNVDDLQPIYTLDMDYHVGVAKRCLLAAAPSVRVWRDVSLWATTYPFMLPILEVLGSIAAPTIRSLMLASSSYSLVHRADHLFIYPLPLFDASLPALTILRHMSTAVPWVNPGYFRTLLSLDLTHLPTDEKLEFALASSSGDGEISSFMVKHPKPMIQQLGMVQSKAPLTMVQLMRPSKGLPEPDAEEEEPTTPPPDYSDTSPVFLEDLETYRIY